ncbi:unnamed protein product [Phaedon cochleariae]|uniref:Uncharacterized protein n=1 Tax=Phaedon cochleariae TaxID=80249 RepID=A0A9N9SCK4_PHACE|nr:unnamed protein product [Phaedon cochleariae]
MNAMNAMRASMDSIRNMDAMRSSVMDMSSSQQAQQQQEALRMQHAEALIRVEIFKSYSVSGNYQGHQGQSSQQLSPDLTEALRLQEQRLEQALRLHGSDPRSLGFSLSSQQQNQQP